MELCDDTKVWLQRGKQRHAIAVSLHGVMSGTQLWRAAVKLTPKLTLRDTRAILRKLEARGLVQCLNPTAPCGRLFVPTQAGEMAFQSLGPDMPLRTLSLPADISPALVSYLLRAHVRHAVFRIVAQEELALPQYRTATTIKRALREKCPVTLNQASRALRDLRQIGLILPVQAESRIWSYSLTQLGVRLAIVMGYRR